MSELSRSGQCHWQETCNRLQVSRNSASAGIEDLSSTHGSTKSGRVLNCLQEVHLVRPGVALIVCDSWIEADERTFFDRSAVDLVVGLNQQEEEENRKKKVRFRFKRTVALLVVLEASSKLNKLIRWRGGSHAGTVRAHGPRRTGVLDCALLYSAVLCSVLKNRDRYFSVRRLEIKNPTQDETIRGGLREKTNTRRKRKGGSWRSSGLHVQSIGRLEVTSVQKKWLPIPKDPVDLVTHRRSNNPIIDGDGENPAISLLWRGWHDVPQHQLLVRQGSREYEDFRDSFRNNPSRHSGLVSPRHFEAASQQNPSLPFVYAN